MPTASLCKARETENWQSPKVVGCVPLILVLNCICVILDPNSTFCVDLHINVRLFPTSHSCSNLHNFTLFHGLTPNEMNDLHNNTNFRYQKTQKFFVVTKTFCDGFFFCCCITQTCQYFFDVPWSVLFYVVMLQKCICNMNY